MDQEMVRSEIVQRVLENHHTEWKFNLDLVPWWGVDFMKEWWDF